MRDNFNISALSNNMFSDLNSLIPLPNLPTVTNISTNVYYGYQPVKNDPVEKNPEENCEMEVQYNNNSSENNSQANIQENTRVINRKRQSSEQQEVEFKKRRENENKMKIIVGKKENIDKWDLQLKEELLRHIHGFNLYNWRYESDL